MITRARVRCDVFSSLRADQIDLRRSQARGVHALRDIPNLRRIGADGPCTNCTDDREPAFAELVARALQGAGYRVERQTGAAAFFLDWRSSTLSSPIGRSWASLATASRIAAAAGPATATGCGGKCWKTAAGRCIASGADWLHRPEMELQRLIKAVEDAQQPGSGRPVSPPPLPCPHTFRGLFHAAEPRGPRLGGGDSSRSRCEARPTSFAAGSGQTKR